MPSTHTITYRAENVGSLLRPPELLEARARHARGEIAHAELKRVEDRAVDEAIALQERSGVDVVTDGELRRDVFASQLIEASDGFETVDGNTVDWYRLDGTLETRAVSVAVTRRIRPRRHLCAEEFAYLRAKTERPTKVTIPAPTMFAYYWLQGVSDAAYPSTGAYLEHVTEILKDEVAEVVRLGCEYIQVDAPDLGILIDPHQREWFAAKGFDPDRLVEEGVAMINEVLAAAPVTTALHVCRGNDANRYMARGGYERIAEEVFPRVDVDVLLLEYDDERSGGFGPLRHVPDDVVVVLGLVSTKRAALESRTELIARVRQAAEHVPLDRLALSAQCGFASSASGNDLSIEDEERKLRLVADVAREIWG
jgi:5-methyltetrahydropteroyltriglutamate--homocysteine methyltransferase